MNNAAHLEHHFATVDQQRETSIFGMWVFLLTEVMFFGGLFTSYAVYHHLYREAFEAAARHSDFWLGTANTFILLGSSFTMAMGVHAAKCGQSKRLTVLLRITLSLGIVFLIFKGVEYAHHGQEHLVPGPGFMFEPANLRSGAELFYYLYFGMTGLHALHMLIGVGVLTVLSWFSRRGRYTPVYHNPIEVAGLYWHFVDIVWLFLYPLFYLVGGH
jgi:cytochrome c oxidase subunit 3